LAAVSREAPGERDALSREQRSFSWAASSSAAMMASKIDSPSGSPRQPRMARSDGRIPPPHWLRQHRRHSFAADPSIITIGADHHLFFEGFGDRSGKGWISRQKTDVDGRLAPLPAFALYDGVSQRIYEAAWHRPRILGHRYLLRLGSGSRLLRDPRALQATAYYLDGFAINSKAMFDRSLAW
jgi:hypothetical protein